MNTTDLIVKYNDSEITVPAGTQITELKDAMAQNFPELKHADVVQVENVITFTAIAGTKGSN